MEIIADLHIHSRYSMATSKLGTPEYLDLWARKKGISLVGTGFYPSCLAGGTERKAGSGRKWTVSVKR